jgi:CBS domain-containing protein
MRMKRNEPIETIMSPDVITVNVTQKLSEVRRLMSEQGIHHVPVVSGRKLVGMLSATDMVRLSYSAYGVDERTVDAMLDHEFSIEKVMQTDLLTIKTSEPIREAARILRTGQLHSLPVVDEANDLAGIVTSTDLIRYLYDQY